MSRFGEVGGKLYRGEVSYDFVGNRKRWYAISAMILLLSIGALIGRQLSLGIEFEGGAVFIVPTSQGTVARRRTRSSRPASRARSSSPSRAARAGVRSGSRPSRSPTTSPRPSPSPWRRPSTSRSTEITAQIVGPSWGARDHAEGLTRPDLLRDPRGDLPVGLLRVADGGRGPRRAGARPRHHRRHLRPRRVHGDAGDDHRCLDHPRLLPLRHRGGLRQGEGEHAGASPAAAR